VRAIRRLRFALISTIALMLATLLIPSIFTNTSLGWPILVSDALLTVVAGLISVALIALQLKYWWQRRHNG
jgi:uncharacterized membrane protein